MTNPHFQRIHLETLTSHLNIAHPPIQVILGPRQVGKTTAILEYQKKWKGPSVYHTADQVSPPDALWVEHQWQKARKQLSGQSRGLLIFDEIQKIPRWSEVVKKCYDEDRRKSNSLCVVLLGSSSLLVQRGLTESLAGRFEMVHFPHWSFKECRDCFGISFDEYVFYGGYPGAWQIFLDSDRNEERWSAYVRDALIETVLNKDILLLTPVTKPALFRQTFQLSCMHPAEIFSLNKMLGQLQDAGNASTIASYLKLLDAAMLLKPLERYSGNRLRQKVSSPKLILLNNALVNASAQRKFAEARKDQALWGRLVENAIGASLVNNNAGTGIEISYWRERDQEVDFVIKFGTKVIGIEVKANAKAKQIQSYGAAFLKKYPKAKMITVARQGGDISLEEFVTMPAAEIFAGTN
ncbi:MAG: ATP-binding protein [Candidatus Omnitrophica bacterium]|nr:ATP-binding protein [Candidatus Omnitrophota bacterium]